MLHELEKPTKILTLKIKGRNTQKLPTAMNTFIQPAAVYMFSVISPGISWTPFSPNGVTNACKAGPTMKPSTWARETIDTAWVRSASRVASDK